MRFIWIKIIVLNFILIADTVLAQHSIYPEIQIKDIQDCPQSSLLEEMQALPEAYKAVKLKILSGLYALGERGCKQNYKKSLQYKRALFLMEEMPMYSLSPIEEADTKFTKQLIDKHNAAFVQKVFVFENSMINFLSPYSDGLGNNLRAYIKRGKESSEKNMSMLNNHGSASVDYCQLDSESGIPVLLYAHPPKKGNMIVVDIGSGWGACSKQLALLGYKVFSVDIEQRHLDFQKDNFCKMPPIDSFLYQYWKVNNPEILDEHLFKQYCDKIKDNNIVYIVGNFADEKTIKEITQDQWSIVLSLDSLQFMNPNDRETTFKLVNQHIQEQGIFIIKTKRKEDYGSNQPLIYDFDLHAMFHKTFIDYKILSAWIMSNEILGLTLYKLSKKHELN